VVSTVFACKCRALETEDCTYRISPRWLLAARGELTLTDTALLFREWVIPYSDMEEAVMFAPPGYLGLAHCLVVRCGTTNYQFQLMSRSPWWYNLDPFWREAAPFAFRFERMARPTCQASRSTIAVIAACVYLVCLSLLPLLPWILGLLGLR
jgi:hypothetical protein